VNEAGMSSVTELPTTDIQKVALPKLTALLDLLSEYSALPFLSFPEYL
jgi:hypothetical protein